MKVLPFDWSVSELGNWISNKHSIPPIIHCLGLSHVLSLLHRSVLHLRTSQNGVWTFRNPPDCTSTPPQVLRDHTLTYQHIFWCSEDLSMWQICVLKLQITLVDQVDLSCRLAYWRWREVFPHIYGKQIYTLLCWMSKYVFIVSSLAPFFISSLPPHLALWCNFHLCLWGRGHDPTSPGRLLRGIIKTEW